MTKLMLIMLLILIAQIQAFACSWSDLQTTFFSEYAKQSSEKCTTTTVKTEKQSAQISCDHKNNYFISYENQTIYLLTQTMTKYPYLTQCWVEGNYDLSCRVQLKSKKCQSWDLRP